MKTDTQIAGSRQRRWTTAQKLEIVEESLAPGVRVAELARRHNVNPNLIYRWRYQAKSGGLSTASGQSGFALVAVAAGTGAARPTGSDQQVGSVVEVVLRNGRLLRVSDSAAPARVAPLADALEGCER